MTDQQHLEYLLSRPPRCRFSLGGCIVWLASGVMFVVFLVALIPNIVASYNVPVPTGLAHLLAAPQTTFSAPQDSPGAPRRPEPPPSPLPRYTPFYAAPAAPEGQDQAPTATALPTATPAAPSFWTEEERAAFTATAEAWYDPATLPTAEPAFVEYAAKACQDPEQVAESATLRLFCGK